MEWRRVPGLPDEYEVSDSGEMRRLPRTRSIKDGRVFHDKAVALRGHVTDKGYRAFRGGAEVRHITAHRAVALAFLGPAPEGYEVCHIDGDKLNNNLSNLRYDTRVGNMLDRRLNAVGAIHGEHHNKTSLTDDDVRKIRALYWIDGQSTRQIASRYDVGKVTIWQIVSGRTWTHLAMPECGSDIARENSELRTENERLRADLEEQRMCLANERGEGEPPCEGWVWVVDNGFHGSWRHDATVSSVARMMPTGWHAGSMTVNLGAITAPTARAAMVAASAALAGSKP